MVGITSQAKVVTSSSEVTPISRHSILKGVYVTKAGASGSKLDLKLGGSGGTILITIEGEAVQDLPILNVPFNTGIYATVTTGGSYLILYE